MRYTTIYLKLMQESIMIGACCPHMHSLGLDIISNVLHDVGLARTCPWLQCARIVVLRRHLFQGRWRVMDFGREEDRDFRRAVWLINRRQSILSRAVAVPSPVLVGS